MIKKKSNLIPRDMLLPKERFEVLFLRCVLSRVDMWLFLECFNLVSCDIRRLFSFILWSHFTRSLLKYSCEDKNLWSDVSLIVHKETIVLRVIVRIHLSTVHTNLWRPLGSFVSPLFFSFLPFFSLGDVTVRPRSCGKYGKTDGEIASFIYNV